MSVSDLFRDGKSPISVEGSIIIRNRLSFNCSNRTEKSLDVLVLSHVFGFGIPQEIDSQTIGTEVMIPQLVP